MTKEIYGSKNCWSQSQTWQNRNSSTSRELSGNMKMSKSEYEEKLQENSRRLSILISNSRIAANSSDFNWAKQSLYWIKEELKNLWPVDRNEKTKAFDIIKNCFDTLFSNIRLNYRRINIEKLDSCKQYISRLEWQISDQEQRIEKTKEYISNLYSKSSRMSTSWREWESWRNIHEKIDQAEKNIDSMKERLYQLREKLSREESKKWSLSKSLD